MTEDAKKGSDSRVVDADKIEPESVKIEFPCEDYPVKIVGCAGDLFKEAAFDVIEKFVDDFDNTKTHINMSRNGKYQAITVMITANSEEQLKAIFEDLKKISGIQMVL